MAVTGREAVTELNANRVLNKYKAVSYGNTNPSRKRNITISMYSNRLKGVLGAIEQTM